MADPSDDTDPEMPVFQPAVPQMEFNGLEVEFDPQVFLVDKKEAAKYLQTRGRTMQRVNPPFGDGTVMKVHLSESETQKGDYTALENAMHAFGFKSFVFSYSEFAAYKTFVGGDFEALKAMGVDFFGSGLSKTQTTLPL